MMHRFSFQFESRYLLCVICLVIPVIIFSCKNLNVITQKTENKANLTGLNARQHAIVYKTTKDFSNLIPVTMDDKRTKIISYPAPSDIYYQGKLAKPTPLKNGYWLDNRGINQNTVFVNYSYEAYSQLKNAPSNEELISKIVEKFPFIELIDCGPRSQFKNEVVDLNSLINSGFQGCKRIKIVPMAVTLDL